MATLGRKVKDLEAEVAELRKRQEEEAKRPKCRTCRFFSDEGFETPGLGECRRNAPRPTPLGNETPNAVAIHVFPRMNAAAWCGEWDPRSWTQVEADAYRSREAYDTGGGFR